MTWREKNKGEGLPDGVHDDEIGRRGQQEGIDHRDVGVQRRGDRRHAEEEEETPESTEQAAAAAATDTVGAAAVGRRSAGAHGGEPAVLLGRCRGGRRMLEKGLVQQPGWRQQAQHPP